MPYRLHTGGRNITPGQELESKEQREAREAQYKAALKAYREKVRVQRSGQGRGASSGQDEG